MRFNALADGLEWILKADLLHYLDNFLLFGEGQEHHKMEGPTTTLVFLVIELGTVQMSVRLPEEKLTRLQAEIKK